MKRIYLLCLLLFPCAAVAAKNKISMVTYFPVPYVAYSRVNTEQMDIGLTSSCDMKLGCAESSVPLAADNTHLTSGTLELNGGLGILGNTLRLGAGIDDGRLLFSNLRIQTGTMQSMNAETMKVDTLKLFDKVFPSCRAANSSDGKMEWKPLRLAGASGNELYLVCGDEGEASTPTCSSPEPAEKKRACTNMCGWQYSEYECVNGTWQESWGDCVENLSPLGDVYLLYQNKALCCPHVDPTDEFEYTQLYDLPPGYTPCYKTLLDTMELVDHFEHGTKCPVDEYGTDGCPNERCDLKDIFEVNCLNWMQRDNYCWIDGDIPRDLYNHDNGIWTMLGGVKSYKCRAKKNGW